MPGTPINSKISSVDSISNIPSAKRSIVEREALLIFSCNDAGSIPSFLVNCLIIVSALPSALPFASAYFMLETASSLAFS